MFKSVDEVPEDIYLKNILNEQEGDDFNPDDLGDEDEDLEDPLWDDDEEGIEDI
jgi:hypothetical protein